MIIVSIEGADDCRQDILKIAITNHLRSCGHCKGVNVEIGKASLEVSSTSLKTPKIMDKQTVFYKVCSLIGHKISIPAEQITESDSLIDDLNMDSLDQVELVMDCKTTFGIIISDDDCFSIKTVSDMVNVVEKHIDSK